MPSRPPTASVADIERLVAPLRADATSGAGALAQVAATVMESAAAEAPADSGGALVESLTALVIAVLDAQPAMAPLVSLALALLRHLDPSAPVVDVRASAIGALRAFRESLSADAADAARIAAANLPRGPILTLSSSGTVRDALIAAAKAGPVRAVCLESRPLSEGRTLARELAAAGVSVTLAVDAAAESLLPECDAVLLGADSIGDRGVVNKIGSAALARGAVNHGLPVMVAADASKLLPVGFPQRLGGDRAAEEVGTALAGVRVWNRYFELVPAELVTAYLTEKGLLQPDALQLRRRALVVPPALAEWAAARQ